MYRTGNLPCPQRVPVPLLHVCHPTSHLPVRFDLAKQGQDHQFSTNYSAPTEFWSDTDNVLRVDTAGKFVSLITDEAVRGEECLVHGGRSKASGLPRGFMTTDGVCVPGMVRYSLHSTSPLVQDSITFLANWSNSICRLNLPNALPLLSAQLDPLKDV